MELNQLIPLPIRKEDIKGAMVKGVMVKVVMVREDMEDLQ